MEQVLDSTDISITINSKIGKIRDYADSAIDEAEVWLNDIIKQTKKQSQAKKDRCQTCNSKEDSRDLELHNIAGRKHDYRQISVCKTCHRHLSDQQKTWDARWCNPDLSENLRDAFFLQGLHDILILKSKKTENPIYEKLGQSLIENISEMLKKGHG